MVKKRPNLIISLLLLRFRLILAIFWHNCYIKSKKLIPEQRPDVVRGGPDAGGQVDESASLATDAPEIRLLLQVAVASQEFRPQFCFHVRPFSYFNYSVRRLIGSPWANIKVIYVKRPAISDYNKMLIYYL